jgi:hypothetical protein
LAKASAIGERTEFSLQAKSRLVGNPFKTCMPLTI